MNGAPKGCGSKGHCTSGRCNKMNTFDWLTNLELNDPQEFQMVEVSFKNGARKEFFTANPRSSAVTGDMVVVEAGNGYDVGRISLSGELVRLQMRKKKVKKDRVFHRVIRRANERDLNRLDEARAKEQGTLVRARAIARTLDMDMKIGDIEYQGDNRKATFYYTAPGRIDFRELVRNYANEFRVKIEMRQIGSRQESARIGGFGPCGRELCCSTWLSDFKSVSTSAARYQNLAINQTKLSGQCGRLKCCLNYELDSYMDALKDFPENAYKIRTKEHKYELVKTDIFKGLMYYSQIRDIGRGPIITLDKEKVKDILALNENNEFPEEIKSDESLSHFNGKDEIGFEDVTGQIELPDQGRRHRKRKNRKGRKKQSKNRQESSESRSGGPSNKKRNRPHKPKRKGNRKKDSSRDQKKD